MIIITTDSEHYVTMKWFIKYAGYSPYHSEFL